VVDAPAPDGRNVVELIGSRMPYLNPALRRVAEFIVGQPSGAKAMTITELATACGVAESTVSRFVKELGLDRYQALRVGIAESIAAQAGEMAPGEQPHVYGGIPRQDSGATIVSKIARSAGLAIRATGLRLDDDAVTRAADLIDGADVILFCAMGGSSIAAEDGVMRFTRAGKKCVLYRDQSLQLMTASVLTSRDVVIGISASGDSTPIVEALRRGRANGARTVAITSVEGSRLVDQADVTLFASDGGASDGALYGEGVTAKWGQLLAIDVLYATFAVRHFDETLAHLQDTYAIAIRETRSR
jgi:RpiR family transcriptional regulator, carbohydrate utilization regulator